MGTQRQATMSDGCKVYCGNLQTQPVVDQRDMEDAFSKFGSIKNIWIARNPPGFAFVTFEDPRDADDAVKEMDGKELDRERITESGQRIRVEVSHGKGKGGGRGGGYDRDRGYDRRDDRGDSYDDRRRDDRRSRSRSRDDRRARS